MDSKDGNKSKDMEKDSKKKDSAVGGMAQGVAGMAVAGAKTASTKIILVLINVCNNSC